MNVEVEIKMVESNGPVTDLLSDNFDNGNRGFISIFFSFH